jgi:hypothetical protein
MVPVEAQNARQMRAGGRFVHRLPDVRQRRRLTVQPEMSRLRQHA